MASVNKNIKASGRLILSIAFSIILLYGYSEKVDAKRIYWTDAGTKKIQRANLDGSGIEDIISGSGLQNPNGIVLDVEDGKMYWTDPDAQMIKRANLDGSQIEVLVVSVRASAIALDTLRSKMYWTVPFADGYLQRSNLDGSGMENVITIGGGGQGITLDAAVGLLYWTHSARNMIQRSNLDGSAVDDLVITGLSDPHGIVLDLRAGKMYWTDIAANKIQRSNLDGTGIEDIISNTGNLGAIGIDVDEGKIYWTTTHKIMRSNLDGSGIEDIVTRLQIPTGIALEAEKFQVGIDIRPISIPNRIDTKSKGRIPVAILSRALFDAPGEVELTSLTFGHTGNETSLDSCSNSPQDVNGDNLQDMICYFNTGTAEFLLGDTQGVLKGKTLSGRSIIGKDSVLIIR